MPKSFIVQLKCALDIRQRGGKTFSRARVHSKRLAASSLLGQYLHTLPGQQYQVAQSGAKVEDRSMLNVQVATELRRGLENLVRRHSCPVQTRRVARGCPLLDVIGHPLTSREDGKFIGS